MCIFCRRLIDLEKRTGHKEDEDEEDEELLFPHADSSRDSRLEWRRDEEVRRWRSQGAPPKTTFDIGAYGEWQIFMNVFIFCLLPSVYIYRMTEYNIS